MKKRRKVKLFKKHLEAVLQRPSADKEFYTNMHSITSWYDHYNSAIFDNKLPKFDEIKIKRIHGAFGQVVYTIYKTKPQQYILEMLPKYPTKKIFLETLAHEMIHLYQMKLRNNTGNHNKLFYSFKNRLNYLGLQLSR